MFSKGKIQFFPKMLKNWSSCQKTDNHFLWGGRLVRPQSDKNHFIFKISLTLSLLVHTSSVHTRNKYFTGEWVNVNWSKWHILWRGILVYISLIYIISQQQWRFEITTGKYKRKDSKIEKLHLWQCKLRSNHEHRRFALELPDQVYNFLFDFVCRSQA